MAQACEQVRGTEVGRLHAADDVGAEEARTDRLAHDRAAAVAADEVVGCHADRGAGLQIASGGANAVRVLREAVDRRTVDDAHAGRRRRALEQDRLEVDLVDAVRRLGGRPVGVGAAARRVAVAPARNGNARELGAGRRRPVGDVVRVVRRQAGVADLAREAELAKHLHRARRDVVALHARQLAAAPRLDDEHVDAALRQVDCQHQPDRPGADDQDLCAVQARGVLRRRVSRGRHSAAGGHAGCLRRRPSGSSPAARSGTA